MVQAIFASVETWYHPHRRHGSLGYLSPVAFEASQPSALSAPKPMTVREMGARPVATGAGDGCTVGGAFVGAEAPGTAVGEGGAAEPPQASTTTPADIVTQRRSERERVRGFITPILSSNGKSSVAISRKSGSPCPGRRAWMESSGSACSCLCKPDWDAARDRPRRVVPATRPRTVGVRRDGRHAVERCRSVANAPERNGRAVRLVHASGCPECGRQGSRHRRAGCRRPSMRLGRYGSLHVGPVSIDGSRSGDARGGTRPGA